MTIPLNHNTATIIRVVKTPSGQAPPIVRTAWVGMAFPPSSEPRLVKTFTRDVLPPPRDVLGIILWLVFAGRKITRGYRVRSDVVIQALGVHAPKAAQWWRENTPSLLKRGKWLVFPEESCRVEPAPPEQQPVNQVQPFNRR